MTHRPRLLDLYSGAGGAGYGYYLAGFDVTGIDIVEQPHYPRNEHMRFIQGDALTYAAAHGYEYDAVHASPPCQQYSIGSKVWINRGYMYPDFLVATQAALRGIGLPYVIENVVGAPLDTVCILCGTMFGLRVFRHRLFESNILLCAPGKCSHKGKRIGFDDDSFMSVAGHGGDGSGKLANWKAAMGIDWMNKEELTEAIPPAYTEYIGAQLIRYVEARRIVQIGGAL